MNEIHFVCSQERLSRSMASPVSCVLEVDEGDGPVIPKRSGLEQKRSERAAFNSFDGFLLRYTQGLDQRRTTVTNHAAQVLLTVGSRQCCPT